MGQTRAQRWRDFAIFATAMLAASLAGCGDDGDRGPPGPPGPGSAPSVSQASALTVTIDSVSINNNTPVVNFTVRNEADQPVSGLTTANLAFTIAKLIPPIDGNPSRWQNYIVTTQTAAAGVGPGGGRTAVQGTRDTAGTLVNNADGSYTYTFARDLGNVACPAPCRDAFGRPLDLSFQPTLTHRVGMQTRGGVPPANATFDFVPNGSPVTVRREIAKTAKCNECHDRIQAHDARIEVKYCVTCHNPGTVDPNSENPAKDTNPDLQSAAVRSSGAVDFKVMIHKIHRGELLPSVAAGGEYAIWGFGNTKHDFSSIVFPQDIRNCTKCHDAADADTPQGGNWNTSISMEACGSCHDNVKFGAMRDASEPDGHPGGVVTDNSTCATCHASGRIAGSVAERHVVPGKAQRAFFKFNILEICGTAVGSNPACPPGSNPTVKFSVSDPTGATTHGFGANYKLRDGADPEFGTGAALNILVGWDTRDYSNTGGTGARPSRAASVNVLTSNAVADHGDGTYTLDGALVTPSPLLIPDGTLAPFVAAEGTGVIGLEGRAVAGAAQVRVNSEVAYFRITDATVKPRRQVVDVPTKCDRCHDLLSFHGGSRNNNGQLCVICHNPNNTDYAQRPKTDGVPTAGIDGKTEEAIDFKRLIHGIHAAAKTNFDGTIAHGFRERGLVVYGFGGTPHDYSHVRFPGVLSKCETCHLPGTFTLDDRSATGGGNWMQPTLAGILGSTTNSVPGASAGTVTAQLADPADDLNISPTAAVCSSCHDGALAREHMVQIGGASFDETQGTINMRQETCAVCHGPGKIASVELVHSPDFGADIP